MVFGDTDRDNIALALYNAALAIGATASYINRGSSATVYLWPAGPGRISQNRVLEVDNETLSREFIIPKQTNFTPSAATRGNQIRFPTTASYYYEIGDVRLDLLGADGEAAFARVTCFRERARVVGGN